MNKWAPGNYDENTSALKNLISPACPLCRTGSAALFHRDSQRDFHQCSECSLVFVPPFFFLPPEAEKAEYDLHQNSPDDRGYRLFLSRIFTAVRERLPTGSRGLDFGAGPGPTLNLMLEEAGHLMEIYDYFYAPAPSAFKKSYDFITATEVVEHLHAPGMELDRLWSCLRPGGFLGVMTKLVLGREEFSRWHYKNDLTHVCFFSRTTFRWLAVRWRADLTFTDRDVIILRKKTVSNQPCSI